MYTKLLVTDRARSSIKFMSDTVRSPGDQKPEGMLEILAGEHELNIRQIRGRGLEVK